ncbi:MAG: ATP-binding protein [Capnocytophaga sp.]|nr:ATP-binding protein [Capnocytophaga sp.]
MINKRLLIKNLLGHSDENSFYDRKRFISLGSKEGKAKFLKHICALANSNPFNNAYIIIGVDDESRKIMGVDFFDDSRIQNLVNAYLSHPPLVAYENISFPDLPENKVVGLVTIRSSQKKCSLRKNIWKYYGGMVFYREGSSSKPQVFEYQLNHTNEKTVQEIEKMSSNNIQHTLDGVMNFIYQRHKDLESHYKVFKEQFVLCWAGKPKVTEKKTYYSRVDIELINEQVRLFYSALDEVEIDTDDHHFTITEYVQLGLGDQLKYYPLEILTIGFSDNGSYKIDQQLIFRPPVYEKDVIRRIWSDNIRIINHIEQELALSRHDLTELKTLPSTSLICYLNGHKEVKDILEKIRPKLKEIDPEAYANLKESLRILRKVKYSQP